MATGCAAEDGSTGTTLRLADTYATTHPFAVSGVEVFTEQVAKHTGGTVGIEYYPAGQMGTPRDLVELTRAGALEATVAAPAYSPDRFPLSTVVDLPGIATSSCALTHAVEPMLAEGGLLYEREYRARGLRPLFIAAIPGYEITTTSRPVARPEDMAGLVMRSTGGAIDGAIRQLGAAGVGMPASEMYEAISKGTVDGTVISPVSLRPYKLNEVIEYSTRGVNLGAVTVPYVISEKAWDGLTAGEQDALEKAGRAASRSLCGDLDRLRGSSEAEMRKDGITFADVTGEAAGGGWTEALGQVRNSWVRDMESRGLPGREALEELTGNVEAQRGAQPK
jgi:TRAP-type C4-dicarboxylate transport system substrate-binding protein